MGTRSLTIFQSDKKDVCVMYRQYDGYLSGHGKELKEFLASFDAITNGIAVGETRKTANGMGCLAAQAVMHFKSQNPVGVFYLEPSGTRDAGAEYRYFVTLSDESEMRCPKIMLKVQSGYGRKWKTIYNGPVSAMPTEDNE